MRNLNLNTGCLLLLAFVMLSFSGKVQAQPGSWSIVQLTDNDYNDHDPHLHGPRAVWSGSDEANALLSRKYRPGWVLNG
ncbi:MAG: hypothetical protein MUO22_00095 [Sedimentisphaerales bacterium]|nr:hypothetical protein [Sedimentisphaerales bacterium]